jgi:UDP-3-O-[3-hydroxymyristoyl] glucosamine N-acyltransferase
MTEPIFVRPSRPITLQEIVALTGAEPAGAFDPLAMIEDVKPLDLAGPKDLTFFDSPKYLSAFRETRAGACLIGERYAAETRKGTALLVCKNPYPAYVAVARALYETTLIPASSFGARGVDSGASVHHDARLEDGVIVDPGAVIGEGAEIGSGTVIGANAVIGSNVRVGRDCSVGANVTLQHTLLGDRVIIHPGTHIGQDGYGYVPTPKGHMKVPQLGRVIIQDDVEIGAGTSIDRGAGRDTMIGEGTKIDNQVHIAHNVLIGRHCIITGQVGISGSVVIGDRAMLGGKVGIVDHITIGEDAIIYAGSGVIQDVPPGTHWMGYPARPRMDFLRELAVVKQLAEKNRGRKKPANAKQPD